MKTKFTQMADISGINQGDLILILFLYPIRLASNGGRVYGKLQLAIVKTCF